MPPWMLCTVPETPSLPLAPVPAGHFTLVEEPTLDFQSGLCMDR